MQLFDIVFLFLSFASLVQGYTEFLLFPGNADKGPGYQGFYVDDSPSQISARQ
jgi:hypothetical protein